LIGTLDVSIVLLLFILLFFFLILFFSALFPFFFLSLSLFRSPTGKHENVDELSALLY